MHIRIKDKLKNYKHLLYSYFIIFGLIGSILITLLWVIRPRTNSYIFTSTAEKEDEHGLVTLKPDEVFNIRLKSNYQFIDSFGIYTTRTKEDNDAIIKISIKDEITKYFFEAEYKYNEVEEFSYLAIFPQGMNNCLNHIISLQVETINLDNEDLSIYKSKEKNSSESLINQNIQNDSFAYTIGGKNYSFVYVWYPITAFAIFITLGIVNDWSVIIERNKKWKKRKKS